MGVPIAFCQIHSLGRKYKQVFGDRLCVGGLSSLLVVAVFQGDPGLWRIAFLPYRPRSQGRERTQPIHPGLDDYKPGPVGTVYTCQGLLRMNGTPVSGACDRRFRFYDHHEPGVSSWPPGSATRPALLATPAQSNLASGPGNPTYELTWATWDVEGGTSISAEGVYTLTGTAG